MQQYTWIYTLADVVDKSQRQNLEKSFATFLNKWQSHGDAVVGRIWIPYNRFVVIQANSNEERPSGCSIDSLKHTVGKIMEDFGIHWLDASYVSYKDGDGNIHSIHFNEMEKLVQQGHIGPQTKVFDHSLGHSDDLDKWEVPLINTWMKRYLPSNTLME